MHNIKGSQLFAILCVLAAVCVSGYFNFTSRGFDWYYFDSLAVLIRSAIWQYNTLPIHDPWACSGTSLLANAQNWLFSPSMLFTLLLPANLGNWLSIIAFKICGFFGVAAYLKHRKVDVVICWLSAAWFVNLTWFALHFAEGHVVFRGFYLLPWILLWAEQLDQPRSFLKLTGAFVFLILDGGIYPAIFALLFCLLRFAIDKEQWGIVWSFLKNRYALLGASLLAAVLTMMPKIYPVLANSENLKSAQEQIDLTFGFVLQTLFNPLWNNGDVVYANMRFHEVGNYLGFGFWLLLMALVVGREKLNRQAILFGGLAIFFAWMSFGWGRDFNPYTLISSLPFLDKLHVQTRYGILFSFALILFLSLWMSGKVPKKMFYGLLILINLECVGANYFSYFQGGESYELPLIRRDVWTKTVVNKPKPLIYYSKDEVSKTCYEPSHSISHTTAEGEPGYKGETESLTVNEVKVDLLVLTPGRIQFSYTARNPADILINSHYLDGWVAADEKQKARDFRGRIALELPAGQGEVLLKYRPPYLVWVVLSYFAGLGLFAYLYRRFDEL